MTVGAFVLAEGIVGITEAPAARPRAPWTRPFEHLSPAARPCRPTLLISNNKGIALEFLAILAGIPNWPGVTPTPPTDF